MSTGMGEVRYFLPESSERIESEEHLILGSIWDTDRPDNELMPEVTEANVFSFDFDSEDYRYWLLRNVGHMCLSARIASQDQATSWHGTKVGASMMALDIAKSRIAFLAQGNHKPQEDAFTNCSEINLLLATSELLRYSQIVALSLAGPKNQTLSPSGKLVSPVAENIMPTTTLLPCYRCDDALAGAPEISEKTLLFSLASHIEAMQIQTFKEYHTRQHNFVAHGMVDDPRVYRFISGAEFWKDTADMYATLRDRRALRSGDAVDSVQLSKSKSKLLTEVLHTASVFYREF